MTNEELGNLDLLILYANVVVNDGIHSNYAVELREEIFMRMEGGDGEA